MNDVLLDSTYILYQGLHNLKNFPEKDDNYKTIINSLKKDITKLEQFTKEKVKKWEEENE